MIPLPSPVPKVNATKFFIPFAAPKSISPKAAAFASFASDTGNLKV